MEKDIKSKITDTFSKLMAPSVALMIRLDFIKKATVLITIVLFAFSVITTNLYQHLHSQIETAQKELVGLELFPHLFELVQLIQQHRGASAGVLGGAIDLSNQQTSLQKEVSNTFELLNQRLPLTILDDEEWHKISSDWHTIAKQGMAWSVSANFNEHIALIKSIHNVIKQVGDKKNLTNSPSLGTYYLINTALYQLSSTQEYLGQTRAFGTGVLAKKTITKSQQIQINTLIAQSKSAVDDLKLNLTKAGDYNPEIKPLLLDASQSIQQNMDYIFKLLKSDIIGETFSISPSEFFNLMTVAIDSSYDTLYETLLPTTKKLVYKQLVEAKETLLTSAFVVFIMAFIGWYFSTGIYLATLSSIQAISNFTTSFSKGHFNKRVELNANNEFSEIGQSFNSMADNIASLIKAEKHAVARTRAIINSSQDAVIQMNISGDIIGWNRQAEFIFGWSSNEVLGQKLHDYIIPLRYQQRHIKGVQHFLDTGNTTGINGLVEIEALHSDGHEFPIELTISPIKVESGYEFNAFIRDITERKRVEDSLKLSSLVFGEAHEGIIITDPAGIIIDVNPSVSLLSGYSREEIIGNKPSLFSSGKQSQAFYAQMWAEVNSTGNWQGEIWNRKKNGELYAELLNISSIKDDADNVLHYVGMFSDITESKQHQEALLKLAHYDVLTQLPNRTLFTDRFLQAIAHSNRTSTQLAVCFLDLDNFKPVNDNYGHEVGDDLLIAVSERIKSVIREEDTVSRQGGDEFTLLLGGIDAIEQCERMMRRLHHVLSQPYEINDLSISIGASSGFTLYPSDNVDLDTLLRHADQAMYQAKLEGKNRFHLFNAEQDKEVIQKIDRLNEIEQALRDDQLCMYYQPKVNMKTGKVFGAEALLRWLHPKKGLIPPMEFLPILEGTDLDITVGNWVIEQALMQLDLWKKQGIELEISINISSHHLQSATFFSVLNKALEKYTDVSSQYLQLEILESSALGDITTISQLIKTCQDELGICVALDDFGTGYSSLTHMRNLPAQTIKIDQSFVRDILDDPNDYSIIDGIIGLAESFNREVIAEGVETTSHGIMLLLMGCEEAQGYGIARPMPATELPVWLKSYTPNQEWLISGQNGLTRQERNIQILKLVSQYWLEEIKKKLSFLQGSDIGSVERIKVTHLKAWRKRLSKEALFPVEWLGSLSQEHEKMETIGNQLLDNYSVDSVGEIAQKVEELQVVYEEMSHLLDTFEVKVENNL